MIPITVVKFGREEEEIVLEVLRSGNVSQGEKVRQFENLLAQLVGVKHAIAVNNGTTSLVAALQILDLKPGDEVLTSPFTFVATLNAILEAGATATFADISLDDFNVTSSSLKKELTERTKVLLPVHLYGQIADMENISTLAQKHNLGLVEDCAQSHGSSLMGRAAGSFGIGSFSFYATKNITTGEGGVITTNDDLLADRLKVLRNQGMRTRYQYEVAGHNYRLTDLQAALGIPQVSRYKDIVNARKENASYLSAGLASLPGVVLPQELPGRSHVWHQYTLRITPESEINRDDVAANLLNLGIGTGIYYPRLVFDYETFRSRPDVKIGTYPNAERAVQEVISIPVYPTLKRSELDRIIDAVTEATRTRKSKVKE